jgi:glutamate-1-semialdehyde 2,1-aminomutase
VFVTTATEAAVAALRLARIATGRGRVAKFETGWHGWTDELLVSAKRLDGPVSAPAVLWDGGGERPVPDTLVLPFNDDAALSLVGQHAESIAAVVFEGALVHGCILARPAFAAALEATCRRHGIVLVLDETVTGLRVTGGVARRLGITPDLTLLGKALGGGLPVACVAGRADLIDGARRLGLHAGGSFRAFAAGMAVARAQLELAWGSAQALAGAEARCARLCAGLEQVLFELGIAGSTSRCGAMGHAHAPESPRAAGTTRAGPAHPEVKLALAGKLLEHGVLAFPRSYHFGFVGTEHSDEDVAAIVAAHRAALGDLHCHGWFDGPPASYCGL